MNASVMAAPTYSADPGAAIWLTAAAVINETTATGPDRQRAAGSKDRIGNQWQDRSVETDMGRQSCEHRVGEALRDKHDRDNDCGDKIVGRLRPGVGRYPVENGQQPAK